MLSISAGLPDARGAAGSRWREQQGSARILISAPHEVEHWRNGAQKWAEPGTGRLAFALARLVDGSAIVTSGTQDGDPSWDEGTPYVRRAFELARGGPVLDLHMMGARTLDIAIGCGPFPDMVAAIADAIAREADVSALRVAVNEAPYRAAQVAVTSQLQQLEIPALQVEMAIQCYDVESNRAVAAWSALGRALCSIPLTRDPATTEIAAL
jgi:hypothetical protein